MSRREICRLVRASSIGVNATLRHDDLGIGFEFTPFLQGIPSIPLVDEIEVRKSKPCP